LTIDHAASIGHSTTTSIVSSHARDWLYVTMAGADPKEE
jgi:hypothetical protein